jgi:choline-sulfatase
MNRVLLVSAYFYFYFLLSHFSVFARPNIIFVMADDLGSWILSSEGYPNTHTPNLDRLATEGVVLENAFSVSAVCSPSRGAFLSSRFPSENGVSDNVVDDKLPGLNAKLVTWPQVLQDSGYNTLMVGKWHLGEGRDVDMPTSRGYTEFAGFLHGGRQSKEPVVDFLKPGQLTREEVKTIDYENVPGDQFTPDLLGDLSVGLIKKYNSESKPFCLSLHFWAPHANTRFPEGYEPPYEDRSWLPMQEVDQAFWKQLRDEEIVLPEPDFPNLNNDRTYRMLREYHSSIHAVDRNVGRVMTTLDELGIADNTVVIFTSDHGYMMGHHGMWHKGNGRWLTENKQDPGNRRLYGDGESRINLFDNSMRVPCVIRWPDRLKAGSRVSQTITHLDWFPTLAAIAQAALPANVLLRGNNALPLLEGSVPPIWDNDLFGQYLNLRTYRTHEWKLVRHYGNRKGDEFYNLVNDPDEKTNLVTHADSQVQRAIADLKNKLTSSMVQIHDPLLSE